MQSKTMSRLRAANPAIVDPERGKEPIARAALQRILEAPPEPRPATRRSFRPQGLALVLAALVLGTGGALAATDPMGWWSSSPSEAHYRVDAAARVPTPRAQQIRCRAGGGGQFDCTSAREDCYQVGQHAPYCRLFGTGFAYTKIDAIPAPPSNSVLSRLGFRRAIARALARGTMTATQAARFRADLARVPDSFFVEFRLASQYATYSSRANTRNGETRVPPPAEPGTLVCIDAAHGLQCRNLNGDASAPIGAGVYSAEPGPGWHTVRSPQSTGGLPPGIHFTPAEYRFLFDLVRVGKTTQGASATTRTRVRRVVRLER